MTLNLQLPQRPSLKPTITVIGVGGAGGNAVSNMIASNLSGVNFVVANTDSQAIEQSLCENQIQLGQAITQGLGAGSYPEVGRASAEESSEEIADYLQGSNMVFITAGLGGGTGTGASPIVAKIAKEKGILTVGVVTKPFHFEGTHRMRVAELGLQELTRFVDTLIVIPNQNLFRVADKNTTFLDAFKLADDVLYSGVRGITDLMVMPGLINLDFSDVRSIMSEMGKAMMGTGEGSGEKRAIEAAEAAIANPLLDNVSMQGARGVLINISGGADMTLFEVDEAANRIRSEVDPDANIIFGSTFDKSLEGRVRVSVVATGIDHLIQQETQQSQPQIIKKEIYNNNKNIISNNINPSIHSSSVTVQPIEALSKNSVDSADAGDDNESETQNFYHADLKSDEEIDVPFIAPEPKEPKNYVSPDLRQNYANNYQQNKTEVNQSVATPPGIRSTYNPRPVFDNKAKSSGILSSLFGTKKSEKDDVTAQSNRNLQNQSIVTPIFNRSNIDDNIDQQKNDVSSNNINQQNSESSPETRQRPQFDEDLDIPAYLRRKSN